MAGERGADRNSDIHYLLLDLQTAVLVIQQPLTRNAELSRVVDRLYDVRDIYRAATQVTMHNDATKAKLVRNLNL